MKIKKKYVFVIIGVFVFLIFLSYFYNLNLNNFDKKILLIEKNLINNIKNNDENIIAISVGNSEKQAIVSIKKGHNFFKVYNEVKKDIKQKIKKNKYKVKYVKIDLLKKDKSMSLQKLQNELEEYDDYTFRNGLILDYKKSDDIILLESELNSNLIIDYNNCTLDLKQLNNYLSKQGQKKVTSLPKNVLLLTSNSYFCDESNKVYELYGEGLNTGRRILDKIDRSELEEILKTSNNYLFNMLQDNGKFIYGYSAVKNTVLNDYNIVRHCGTIWSLAAISTNTLENKNKILLAINYLLNYIENYNDDIAFITYRGLCPQPKKN